MISGLYLIVRLLSRCKVVRVGYTIQARVAIVTVCHTERFLCQDYSFDLPPLFYLVSARCFLSVCLLRMMPM